MDLNPSGDVDAFRKELRDYLDGLLSELGWVRAGPAIGDSLPGDVVARG